LLHCFAPTGGTRIHDNEAPHDSGRRAASDSAVRPATD
jgi:hypothetical protein